MDEEQVPSFSSDEYEEEVVTKVKPNAVKKPKPSSINNANKAREIRLARIAERKRLESQKASKPKKKPPPSPISSDSDSSDEDVIVYKPKKVQPKVVQKRSSVNNNEDLIAEVKRLTLLLSKEKEPKEHKEEKKPNAELVSHMKHKILNF